MDPAQLQPGYRLDRYELLCPLAHGGMATVWLARLGSSFGFEQLFVVKMILPQYSQDPLFRSMFVDEARIASRIDHSNVARIEYVGEHLGNYFMVLEWVDGDSVSKILRGAEQAGETLPFGVAARILADAAAGLHAAHELKDRDGTSLGVVHRDVSPQNILVSNDGATKIIDFGVAKAKDRVSHTTSTGQLKGKIRYMAPEQALGRALDHRADVWALGAIFYEMLTGKPPYEAGSEIATLHKLTSGLPPPPIPVTVPLPFRSVAERAIAVDPERRFATAHDLSLALEKAMKETGQRTTEQVVARYTADLLAERKATRRKALDAALVSVRERGAAAPAPPPLPAVPSPPRSARGQLATGAPHGTSPGSWPSALLDPRPPESAPSASVLGEAPTRPSTLGSANIEYAPPPDERRARRVRLLSTAALGASLAAGALGAVLIVSSVAKRAAPLAPAAVDLPPPTPASAAEAEPPPSIFAPPVVAQPASEEPEEIAPPTSAPIASASASSPDEQDGDDAAPARPTAATPPVERRTGPAKPSRATAVPGPAPAPKPAPASTRIDRGF